MVAAGSTTRAAAFIDSGFIDGWFIAFRPVEHTIKTDFRLGTIVIYCLTYGSLLAANHAPQHQSDMYVRSPASCALIVVECLTLKFSTSRRHLGGTTRVNESVENRSIA
jgi:hypothetical protein